MINTYTIQLTQTQDDKAVKAANHRHNTNTTRIKATQDNTLRVDLSEDIKGMRGEFVVRKFLNIKTSLSDLVVDWEQFQNNKHLIADINHNGILYEIKTIYSPRYNLICNVKALTEEKLSRPHILVYYNCKTLEGTLLGYAYGSQIKQCEVFPSKYEGGEDYYLYPTENLQPITDLFPKELYGNKEDKSTQTDLQGKQNHPRRT